MGICLGGWSFIVVLRLVQLQVFNHDKYHRLAEAQQARTELIQAPRGDIFGLN